MSEIIGDFKSKRGRPEVYPWDYWADGKPKRLYTEIDFHASPMSMRTMLHRKARLLGLRVYTHIAPDNSFIDIRFYQ